MRSSSSILRDVFAEHCVGDSSAWCRATNVEEYGRGKHDKIKKELSELMRFNPEARTREANKWVLRLNDTRKLKKDVPDRLLSGGSSGNTLVFDAEPLEDFLGELPFERRASGLLTRLLKGRR